jgi:hypothetical protein
MQDVIYVLVTVAFFVLMAVFVIGCERIVGDGDAGSVPGGEVPTEHTSLTEEVAR